MTELTFYISGPMTGLPEFNYPAFQAAADKLRSEGHTVFSPHETTHWDNGIPGSIPWEDYIRIDLIVMLEECNAMVLLPGWENSKGARFERDIAKVLNFTIYELSNNGDLTLVYVGD